MCLSNPECGCQQPPFKAEDFASTYLGCDPSEGRYAEVSLQRCLRCERVWLVYQFEIEGLSHSGRWYRGLLQPEQVAAVRPQQAAALLASLPSCFVGGSYFESSGFLHLQSAGPLF